MRVISGKYRGRKIVAPENNDIRPTTDKVKESIFSTVQSAVDGGVVLDLFSGTGALGIEAISRGAKKTYFCDCNPKSLDLLVKNLSFCDKSEYELFKGDFTDCLRLLASRGVKCDLILCDPPYASDLTLRAMERIAQSGLLKEGGTMICERLTDAGETKSPFFVSVDTKTFGKVSYDVFRNLTKCALVGTFDPFTEGHAFLVKQALDRFDFVYIGILVNPDKEARYSVETRKKMIRLACGEYKRRIKIEYYDGMTADYCKERGVKTLIRGVRNQNDKKYEEAMARYNKEHGGVDTLFFEAERAEISSTEAKRRLDEGESFDEMVCDDVIRIMKSEKK